MGLTLDEGLEKAEECLDELVAVQSRAAVDMFYAMMEPLHSSTWQVLADESGLAKLRELNKRYALVFLPAHRSYVDTLVLGDVLARNDFPRNHVMGGANLRIWPISDLARRAGIVFIRRSFGDDEIYKAVVQEYFAFLLAKRFNLEWYFEGGRSRTGKIRSPRYGLLRYVAEAVQSGRVEDVYLVPTSITYDRLHEVSSMAAEQAGAKKQAEGLKWLADYARSQRRTSGGSAYVRFGDPIAIRSWLPSAGASADDNRAALHKLAFEVAVGINHTSPLTANGLLALTLLGVRDQSLTLGQIQRILEPVLGYIEARGLPSTGLERLRDAEELTVVLAGLVRAKVVTVYDKGEVPVYAVDRGQHLVAAFYRNNAIHWFVNRAILELALLWTSQQRVRQPRADRLDRGQAHPRPAQVRVLLPRPRHVRGRAARRARADLPRIFRPGRGAERLGRADGPPGAAVLPRRTAGGRRPARGHRPGPVIRGAARQGDAARRVRPRRPADAAATAAAQPRVGLARAVRVGHRPQGQLRPAGAGRR